MSTKRLFYEETEVPVSKSIGQIQELLIEAGAQSINSNYENGAILSLSFVLPVAGGQIPYLLPVRVEQVFAHFKQRRRNSSASNPYPFGWEQRDREQSAKVAWRQIYHWLKANLALIQLGQVEAREILLPYMLGPDGRSFFDTYKAKLLPAPEAKGAK